MKGSCLEKQALKHVCAGVVLKEGGPWAYHTLKDTKETRTKRKNLVIFSLSIFWQGAFNEDKLAFIIQNKCMWFFIVHFHGLHYSILTL